MYAPSSSHRETPGKFATYLALTSFAIGTLLLLLHLQFTESVFILIIGYLYVVAAFFINLLAVLFLICLLIRHWQDRQTIAVRIMILLSNLPIALCYLNIVTKFNLF